MLKASINVVEAWQDAANRQDTERLLELSDSNIEIVGPRGSARGHQILKEWLSRAGLKLETLRMFARGEVIVAAQRGVWHSVETNDVVNEADIATVFRVKDGRISYLARYGSLEEALTVAGFNDESEVAPSV